MTHHHNLLKGGFPISNSQFTVGHADQISSRFPLVPIFGRIIIQRFTDNVSEICQWGNSGEHGGRYWRLLRSASSQSSNLCSHSHMIRWCRPYSSAWWCGLAPTNYDRSPGKVLHSFSSPTSTCFDVNTLYITLHSRGTVLMQYRNKIDQRSMQSSLANLVTT